ncbi:GGDEF domain-containing protein [Burkholderiaceae bacterium FT117]|uniref:GGDEF domain-containing protein n=1 Tax=Zeimonas sediminis TaxID=2944268 RepID=UPI002342D6EB|nr:GGDEF domain-containing protein [Zeimonas sediminis]MCM5570512.1 GGDEF domain-containing protein [Zeimonas sediminis]
MDLAIPLDIRSIFLVSGIGSLLGAGFLFGMRPRAGELREAFGLFSLAVTMMGAAFIGLGLGGMPDSVAGRVASNVLVAGATVAIWQACRRVAGRAAQPALLLVALGVLALVLWPLSLESAAQPLRHLLGSVWALGFLALALRELLASPPMGDAGAMRLARGTLWVFCALLLARIAGLVAYAGPGAAAGAGTGVLLGWFNLVFATVPFVLTISALAIANSRLAAELERLVGTDDLTGLVSRRVLFERGEAMLERLPADGCLAVLMIDLDDFKRVNDAHGHATGDGVLRHVARLLREALRDDSLIVRYGGDEFCALVPVSSEAAAFVVGERLRHALAATPCPLVQPPVAITASIGVTVHRQGSSLRERLAEADRRAYNAKASGRNQVIGDRSMH